MIARPTEYRGIAFDSKAEAVFARSMDLAGLSWIYHPSFACEHQWDFLVTDRRGVQTLVEYKPSMPTNTYVDWLTDMMRSHPHESVVIWGNPWDGVPEGVDGFGDCCYTVYPIFSSAGKFGWGDFIRLGDNGGDWPTSWRHDTFELFGLTDYEAQAAKLCRFDLVG
jgi:hypothetical protein